MPRRSLLLLSLVSFLFACSEASAPKTNLILITVDTLRADHMSLHGYERLTTPRLEHWAEQGTVFERASSTSSWTLPSMQTILTGEWGADAGMGRILEDQVPLAEVLADAGYRTGAVVANVLLNEEMGFRRGFETYQLTPPIAEIGLDNEWRAEEIVSRGIAWLKEGGERPSFLMLHLFDPHGPYRPRAGIAFEASATETRLDELREITAEDHRESLTPVIHQRIENQIAAYDSEILQVDAGLDRLFEYLDESGLTDTTLVVLTSDHGEGLWQRARNKGKWPPAHWDIFVPLYGGHGEQLYSEQIHVPLIMRGPGVPVARRTEPVSLIDLCPTILAQLRVEAPEQYDGLDLFAGRERRRNPAFAICTRSESVTVDGRWRFHAPSPLRAKRFGAQVELYDLQSDPGELHPIENPDRVAHMRGLIDAWRRVHTRKTDQLSPVSQEQLDLLRSLGYTSQADEFESAAKEQ